MNSKAKWRKGILNACLVGLISLGIIRVMKNSVIVRQQFVFLAWQELWKNKFCSDTFTWWIWEISQTVPKHEGGKFSASARCLFSNKLLEKTYSLSKYYSTANIVITALSASSSLHNQAIFTAVINDKGRWENTGKVANHEPQRFLH